MQDTTSEHITEPTFDPKRRYRCRHVFTDGHRCGSPALREEDLCYYHHASRSEPQLAGRNGYFMMPRIDDRPAIQIALYDILSRLSQFDIEPKRAGMLLYGLQIASSNLSRHERSAVNTEPVVEEIVSTPFLGNLALIAEMPDLAIIPGAPEPALGRPKGSTASPSGLGLPPTNVAAPITTIPPITPVILSAAKNPCIQPGAPQTSAETSEISGSFRTAKNSAELILAAVHATAASTTRSCPALEPGPNLEPSTVPLRNLPAATPYNRPNDFAYSGLPASSRNVPLPG